MTTEKYTSQEDWDKNEAALLEAFAEFERTGEREQDVGLNGLDPYRGTWLVQAKQRKEKEGKSDATLSSK